jgi:tRNA pseudouridine13 synthase
MYMIKESPEDFIVHELSNVELGGSGRYTYFVLRKTNYTTEDAIARVSGHARLPRKFFGYAGNKDRRAITDQLCSVKGRISGFSLDGLEVEVVGHGDSAISLGDLIGNRFDITVRNIDSMPMPVDKVPNFFDQQRFGLMKNNHVIGRLILKRDFRSAVELIRESGTKVDDYLAGSPNDSVGALRRIPRKILTMYVNAYQSYLWNRTVEEMLSLADIESNPEIPLVGFGTEYSDSKVRSIIEQFLSEDCLTQRSFVIREIPELSSEGSARHVYSYVRELEIDGLQDDELHQGMKKICVRFSLDKGCYATIVIKIMFKQ